MIENEEKYTAPAAHSAQQETERTRRPEEGSSSHSPRKNFKSNPRRSSDKRKFFMKKKVCFFCNNKDVEINYKDVNLMRRYVAESGKITPRRFSGTCAKHQRKLSTEIKKARQMALIPYTDR